MNRFSRSSSYPRVDAPAGSLLGDGFVPDRTLEEWLRTGAARRDGALLVLSDGRRFALTDGLRILGRRNGDSDPYGITGRVLGLRSLLKRGALLSADGVRLGPVIYDVELGSIAGDLPAGSALTEPPPSPRIAAGSSAPPSPR
jgi:hypothetical protein